MISFVVVLLRCQSYFQALHSFGTLSIFEIVDYNCSTHSRLVLYCILSQFARPDLKEDH